VIEDVRRGCGVWGVVMEDVRRGGGAEKKVEATHAKQ